MPRLRSRSGRSASWVCRRPAGFVGRLELFRASLDAGSVALVALIVLGSALSFVYMFQLYQHSYWRERSGRQSPRPLRLIVFAVAMVVVAAGLWPEPLLRLGELSAAVLAEAGP